MISVCSILNVECVDACDSTHVAFHDVIALDWLTKKRRGRGVYR